MRLKQSRNASQEALLNSINSGYTLLNFIVGDYSHKRVSGTFIPSIDIDAYVAKHNKWNQEVEKLLDSIFPTQLEVNQFRIPKQKASIREGNMYWSNLVSKIEGQIELLLNIIHVGIDRYTDIPLKTRLYVEDIDSFCKVRDVNPSLVAQHLNNGYFDVSEDLVQTAIERILGENFHKKDWGGETSDLFTSNLQVNGHRLQAAFMLKGHGLKSHVMQLKDCGKNGDQIVRLMESPADLYVVQFVGTISETVVKDIEGKILLKRANGHEAVFCIINGNDTVRLFKAYGEI